MTMAGAELELALATFLFVATHLALSHPLRPALVRGLGERGFLLVYSLVALVTFGWIVFAYRATLEGISAWIAPIWWWPIASGLMLVASILLAGSLIRNPAFPHPGAGLMAIPPPRGVFAITRHPMNISIMIWAIVHVSISGSPRNLIVAAGMFVLALAGSIGQDRKKVRLLGQPWREWRAQTSFVPFAALLAGRLSWRSAVPDWRAIVGGLLFWAIVTSWHAPIVSPLADTLRGWDFR